MPYCQTALVADDPNRTSALIKSIAVEHFRARDAYLLDNDSWNIDAGENDVRAINRNDNGVIRFFCRYVEDVRRTESKVKHFAENHSDECSVEVTNKPNKQT